MNSNPCIYMEYRGGDHWNGELHAAAWHHQGNPRWPENGPAYTAGVVLLWQALRDVWSNERLLNLVEQLLGSSDILGHPVWNLRTKTPQNEATTVPWHQGMLLLYTLLLLWWTWFGHTWDHTVMTALILDGQANLRNFLICQRHVLGLNCSLLYQQVSD